MDLRESPLDGITRVESLLATIRPADLGRVSLHLSTRNRPLVPDFDRDMVDIAIPVPGDTLVPRDVVHLIEAAAAHNSLDELGSWHNGPLLEELMAPKEYGYPGQTTDRPE